MISNRRKREIKTNLFVISFVAIPVVLLILFTYYPAVKLVAYSFSDYNGMSSPQFIGLRNWKAILLDKETWQVIGNSFYYIIGGVAQNIIALVCAVCLNNNRMKGRNIFRGVIFLPFILNGTAVSYLFRYFYDYTKGPLNILLTGIGLAPVSWLGDAGVVNWSLAFICLWRYTGYLMIIYLAALQSIPSEHYEAARIDGCNTISQFFYITLPQLSGVIKLQMFLNVSGAIAIFDIPFVITGGGPSHASETITMKANQFAFEHFNFGMASAFGLLCTVIVIVVYIAQDKLLFKKEE